MGVPDDRLLVVGLQLLDCQMLGMLLGGLFFGWIGDRFGRRTALFGSILLYSLANLANAAVTSVEMYAWLRFISGLGLAGEVGAAVTLVSERLSKEDRGYGTMLLAGLGVMGAMSAGLAGDYLPWRWAYVLGGALGLVLLVLRAGTPESPLFQKLGEERRGDLWMLLKRWPRYLRCILLGVPVWFVVAIFVTFIPEIAKDLGCTGPVRASHAVFTCFVGAVFGDFASGCASQWLKSRRKALFIWITCLNLVVAATLLMRGLSPDGIYACVWWLGFFTGYWAVFITVAAEQFGTNLRATVAVSVPNMVRGSVVVFTALFLAIAPEVGRVGAAALVGALCSGLAYAALAGLPETYGLDLDYVEGDRTTPAPRCCACPDRSASPAPDQR